jgi:hypothetical protein
MLNTDPCANCRATRQTTPCETCSIWIAERFAKIDAELKKIKEANDK